MADTFGIRLLIEAENRATGELEKLPQAMGRITDTTRASGQQMAEATRYFRLFGASIASEINPALGAMVVSMSNAGRATSGLSLSFATLVTGAALAATALAQWIQVTSEATRRSVEFEVAVKGMNFAGVKSQIDAAALSLKQFDESLVGIIASATRGQGTDITGFQPLNLLDRIFGRTENRKFLDEAPEKFARLLPTERIRTVNEELAKQAQIMQSIFQLESQRNEERNQLEAYAKTQERIRDFLEEQLVAERRLIDIRAEAEAAAARARPIIGAMPGELGLIEQRRIAAQVTLETTGERGIRGLNEITRRGRMGILDRRYADAVAAAGGGEYPASAAELYAAEGATRREPLQVDQQRLNILQQIQGYTAAEAAAVNLRVIESERLLKVEDARGVLVKEELANLDAQVKASNVLRAELERTNALAGLAKGFRDVAEEAESAGRVMQDFARNTASSMQRSFSDLFFNVITGQFKSLPDIGKQFGLSLVRNLSDAFAQSASAPILRLLSGILPGGNPGFFGSSFTGPAGISGGNYPGLIAPQSGSGSNLSWLYSASAGGGGGYSGGAAAESAALYDIYFGGPGAPSATSTFAANAAGLGYAALIAGAGYAASRATGSMSTTISTILTGVTLGSAVAGLFAGGIGLAATGGIAAGVGAGIGAGAAGAVGGGFSAAIAILIAGALADVKDPAKSPDRAIGAQNIAKEFDAGVRRINAASTFEELAQEVRNITHRAWGGPDARGINNESPGFAIYIKGRQVTFGPDTIQSLATDLSDAPETFKAVVQLGIDPQAQERINTAYTQAVQARADALNRFSKVPLAFEDVGPGLRRRTIVPFSAAGTIPPGTHALATSSAFAINQLGLTPDQWDALLRRLREVNSQRDTIPDWPEGVFLKV